jgi:hypothetical protein
VYEGNGGRNDSEGVDVGANEEEEEEEEEEEKLNDSGAFGGGVILGGVPIKRELGENNEARGAAIEAVAVEFGRVGEEGKVTETCSSEESDEFGDRESPKESSSFKSLSKLGSDNNSANSSNPDKSTDFAEK